MSTQDFDGMSARKQVCEMDVSNSIYDLPFVGAAFFDFAALL